MRAKTHAQNLISTTTPHDQRDKSYQKNVTTLLSTCQNTWSAIIKSVWTNHLITLNHKAVIWNELILTVMHWIMLVFYALTPQSKNERNFQDLGLFLDPIAIPAWVVKYFIFNLLLIMDSFSQYETVLLPQRMVPNWRNCSESITTDLTWLKTKLTNPPKGNFLVRSVEFLQQFTTNQTKLITLLFDCLLGKSDIIFLN